MPARFFSLTPGFILLARVTSVSLLYWNISSIASSDHILRGVQLRLLQAQQGDGEHRFYDGGIRKASFLMSA